MLDIALNYLNAGLCVLPANAAVKRPVLTRWKQYRSRLPTETQLRTWLANEQPICVVAGSVSGNLEMLDFDFQAELFDAWYKLVVDRAPGLLERLVVERSQSGGRHVVYRCESGVPGSRKLAQRTIDRPDDKPFVYAGKTLTPRRVGDHYEVTIALIETRGEGGLFLCAPTPGYVLEQGSFEQIPMLKDAELAVLIGAALELNEVPQEQSYPQTSASCGFKPGDDFNQRGDVREILRRHGWTLERSGQNEHWRRPGKNEGTSATLKDDVFYVFSSNAAPFEPDTPYSPFAVYALLEHGGDFRAAAAALRCAGYGGDDTGVDLSRLVINGKSPPPTEVQPQHADPGPLPDAMYRVPGFVSEVMDHCLATAPYPNDPLAFCGAVSLQAMLAGRKVRDEGDNRTNIYLLALANSAAGKDHPRKINNRILHEVGLANCLGERFASGEGIQDALFQTPNMLFQTDEIDGLLASINRASDSRHESIMGTLLTMYSSANSVVPMRRKAGKDPPRCIDQPCLVLFGTAIPKHYYAALNERMLTNGLFGRTLVVEAGSRGAGQEPQLRDLPQRVLETAKWWAKYPGDERRSNLHEIHPNPTAVEHTEDAKKLLAQIRLDIDALYSKAESENDPVGTTVWGRVSEHTRKLALIYAVSENHVAPKIDFAAVDWASRFVIHHAKRMLFMAASHVAETPFHEECLKLKRKLREAPGQRLPHSVLMKRMKRDRKTFVELIATLEAQGDVVVKHESTAGRSQCIYQLAPAVSGE